MITFAKTPIPNTINHLHRNLELELQSIFSGDTVQPPTAPTGGSRLQLFSLWEGLFQVGGGDLLIWLLFISSSLSLFIPFALSTFLDTTRRSRLIFSSCAFLVSAWGSTTNQGALAPFIGERCSEVEIRVLGVPTDAGVSLLPGTRVRARARTHTHTLLTSTCAPRYVTFLFSSGRTCGMRDLSSSIRDQMCTFYSGLPGKSQCNYLFLKNFLYLLTVLGLHCCLGFSLVAADGTTL